MPDPTPTTPTTVTTGSGGTGGTTATTPVSTPAASETTPPAPDGGAGGNGQATAATSAAADWRAGLEGEAKDFAARLATPHDAVKFAIDARKLQSQMVRVPAPDAKPEDIQRFHKAIGVPDNPGDYEFDLGREATEADKAVQAEVAKIALETGVSKTALKALSKGVTALAQAQAGEADRVAIKAREAAAAALKKEFGADYDGNLVVAKRALDKFGGPDLLNVIENATLNGAKLGDHPAVIKAFAIIGRRMGEGDFIGAVGSAEQTVAQERITQLLNANPPGTEKYKDPAVQRELKELYSKLYGNEPTAGFGGRLV